ncbi:hypothetical protein ACQ86N_31530 [Puia sp. P3]|uniref:hypothetical protein n=1 Tax=Puia sp. P3 TaxID=3423952 RepID=UPI003D672558
MPSPKHTTRWREHEFLLVTLLCTIAVVGNFWRLLQHSATALARDYGENFFSENLPFTYTGNILLPDIATPILIYVSYVSMNLFILPRLLHTEGAAIGSFRVQVTNNANARILMSGPGSESLRRFIIGLAQTFLLIIGLGTGLGIAYFYRHRPFMPRDISNIMIMGKGLRMAINLTIAYTVYAIIRETLLKKLERLSDTMTGRIQLLNQLDRTHHLLLHLRRTALLFRVDGRPHHRLVLRHHPRHDPLRHHQYLLDLPAPTRSKNPRPQNTPARPADLHWPGASPSPSPQPPTNTPYPRSSSPSGSRRQYSPIPCPAISSSSKRPGSCG